MRRQGANYKTSMKTNSNTNTNVVKVANFQDLTGMICQHSEISHHSRRQTPGSSAVRHGFADAIHCVRNNKNQYKDQYLQLFYELGWSHGLIEYANRNRDATNIGWLDGFTGCEFNMKYLNNTSYANGFASGIQECQEAETKGREQAEDLLRSLVRTNPISE